MNNNLKSTSILVVEDKKLIREHLTTVLKKRFPYIKIYHAQDAKDALHKFIKNPCDIIILDMRLGKDSMSGIDVFRHLKAGGYKFYTIGVSAFIAEYAFASGHSGIDAFLQKPIENERLFNLIDDVISNQNKSIKSTFKLKLIPITIFLVGVVIAIVTNIISNILPNSIQKYLWLSWPLLIILIIISVILLLKK